MTPPQSQTEVVKPIIVYKRPEQANVETEINVFFRVESKRELEPV